jgi:dTDP-L-rhamnose 4-epimerase
MQKRVLITGGAGFIGVHVGKELLSHGYTVRALDSLVPQVHGGELKRPDYLDPEIELVIGDVRDTEVVKRALQKVDSVVHLAALVGVGQSMYEIAGYTSVNNLGAATLMQAISRKPVETVVVASSMSIYGEGLYRDADGQVRPGPQRSREQLCAGDWEPRDEQGRFLAPIPTPEDKVPALASVYALSKYDQEQMTLLVAAAYGVRGVALRFFNTYGPYQALSNPYTGVLSNFAARVLNDQPPLIYEDGMQKRDLVSVYDVAAACRLAIENRAAAGAFNISSGTPVTIREVAQRTIQALGSSLRPEITSKYRVGDIRHCFADISRARDVLGWRPRISMEEGITDLANWLAGQRAVDRGQEAREELALRGLML